MLFEAFSSYIVMTYTHHEKGAMNDHDTIILEFPNGWGAVIDIDYYPTVYNIRLAKVYKHVYMPGCTVEFQNNPVLVDNLHLDKVYTESDGYEVLRKIRALPKAE